MRVTVETDQLTRSVAGTLFAGSRPRIVEIKGIKVEADFAPHMLYVTNQDKPGFIGRFGATLAGAGINIATFHLGRASQGGDAICLVSVDEEVPEDVLVDGAHLAAGSAGNIAGVLMAVSPGFQDFILDLLAPLEPLPRRMFSGVGLFHGGAMFGLLVRDTMYLRVDDATREQFEQRGSRPFSYRRGEREVSLSAYYVVPEDLLDRQDELLRWARDAIAASRRATSNARAATSRSGGPRYRKKPTADSG